MRLLSLLFLCISLAASADPAVIGHPELPPIDPTTLQRIYTGKVIEVAGIRVTPVDLPPGNPLRQAFLRRFLQQDEESYVGYWTVRRYIGKGVPPRQLTSPEEVLRFVAQHKGSIGYVDAQHLNPGVSLLLPAR